MLSKIDYIVEEIRQSKKKFLQNKINFFIHYNRLFWNLSFLNTVFRSILKVKLLFRVYQDLGGRFPSDFVLPTLKMPVLLINGNMDRFIMNPKLLMEKIPKSK